jgi:hypothetical protein
MRKANLYHNGGLYEDFSLFCFLGFAVAIKVQVFNKKKIEKRLELSLSINKEYIKKRYTPTE